jgi:type I restriction enzyme M protein
MTTNTFNDITKIESSLWDAADQLRANSKLTASEYCMPVLGVIFLRHAFNRYQSALASIQADQASGKLPKRPIAAADFVKRRALKLPEISQYDWLLKLPSGTSLGTALVDAMNAIEADFEPLAGQLPKDYDRFENKVLEDLLRNFDSAALRNATGDVFGRIYEYFLMKFAMQGAQDNGEFFTPPSLVQTLVNVIEPDHGVVADLACGSGGMFVQSSHFIEHEGLDTMKRVTFFGQEKTATTIRLAKMNLAVHGLEGDIREANSFYDDVHRLQDGRPLWGNCDFVMANPPFNVDKVDAERVKTDRRLPFGLPGVNKEKHVSNGNYLWISYFHSYLSEKGRAGFVMSSQASSAGHGEKEVRRKLVETGDVDVMIAIRSNFFYTRTVPCELWHFDRAKPAARKDQVLMLDARNVYRKVTRKIYDFSPEQQANLTAIVWLYRGQQDRFLGLVQSYIAKLVAEASQIEAVLTRFEALQTECRIPIDTFLSKVGEMVSLPQEKRQAVKDAFTEWTTAAQTYAPDRETLANGLASYCKAHAKASTSNAAQHKARQDFDGLTDSAKSLGKHIDLLYKLATRTVQASQDLASDETVSNLFGRISSNKAVKQLEDARRAAIEQLKLISYCHRQIAWLHDRFPEAEMADVLGLCKIVSKSEIKAADWSLTPGRFVGIAPSLVDDDFDFEQSMRDLHFELAELNVEADALSAKINDNFSELVG